MRTSHSTLLYASQKRMKTSLSVNTHGYTVGPRILHVCVFIRYNSSIRQSFFLKGWGKREPVDVDDKNDDKLHEVEVTASLDTLLSSSKKTLFPAQYCALL